MEYAKKGLHLKPTKYHQSKNVFNYGPVGKQLRFLQKVSKMYYLSTGKIKNAAD